MDEKIKCYKLLIPAKYGGYIGHIIPEGKSRGGAIIMLAGETEASTEAKLLEAINNAPQKYKDKYDFTMMN